MKNLRRLACKFDLNQSERKSSQVNASARKSWPNGVASRPKFSTCGYLRLRLARALNQSERKSSQVNTSARKSWPNGVASRPKFSTCGYLRLRLARALGSRTRLGGGGGGETTPRQVVTLESRTTFLHINALVRLTGTTLGVASVK